MKKYLIPAAIAVIAVGGVGIAMNQTKDPAIVNGTAITMKQMEEQISALSLPNELMEKQGQKIKASVLEQLINQELLQQTAKKEKVFDDAEFKKRLDVVTRNLVSAYTVEKHIKEQMTDDMVMAEYKKLEPQYNKPVVKARHILVDDEETAKKVIKQLQSGEKGFVALAQEFSKDPSAENGGDLGWFTQDVMVEEFAEKAFSMDKGTYTSEPVQTQFGWHVILVEDRKENNMPDIESVRPQIEQQLQRKLALEYVNSLREEAQIVYSDNFKPEANVQDNAEASHDGHEH